MGVEGLCIIRGKRMCIRKQLGDIGKSRKYVTDTQSNHGLKGGIGVGVGVGLGVTYLSLGTPPPTPRVRNLCGQQCHGGTVGIVGIMGGNWRCGR